VTGAESAQARRTGFESWLIEHELRERVYVLGQQPGPRGGRARATWLSIAPEDLAGSHTYVCHLDPETPSNKLLDVEYHAKALELKLETPDQAIVEMGGNPDEVEEGWLLWEMKQDPAVLAQLKQRVFQQLGTLDQQLLQGNAGQPDLTQVGPQPLQGQPGETATPQFGPAPGAGAPPGMPPGPPGGAPTGPLPPGASPSLAAAGQVFAPGVHMPVLPPRPKLPARVALRGGGMGRRPPGRGAQARGRPAGSPSTQVRQPARPPLPFGASQ